MMLCRCTIKLREREWAIITKPPRILIVQIGGEKKVQISVCVGPNQISIMAAHANKHDTRNSVKAPQTSYACISVTHGTLCESIQT